MFPALYDQLEYPPPLAPRDDAAARSSRACLQAMRDWLVLASQQRPLMIAVDDADHVDDGSAACLALLAGDTRAERLGGVRHARERDARARRSSCSRAEATRIDLVPLSAGQTARLLRSVFGEVPHVQVVAEWIHALSQGHPRTVMELSQYLVDHGIARFERGSWTLPETLRDAALPESIEQARGRAARRALAGCARAGRRRSRWSPSPDYLELDEIVRLTGSQSPEQTFGAVDELLAAQVIAAVGSTHHVRHRGLSRALHNDLSPERRRMLHLRLANLYQTRAPRADGGEQALLVAYHRRLGGDMPGLPRRAARRALAAARRRSGTRPRPRRCTRRASRTARRSACRRRGCIRCARRCSSLSATGRSGADRSTRSRRSRSCAATAGFRISTSTRPSPMRSSASGAACARRSRRTRDKPEAQRGLPPIEALSEVGA